MDRDKLISVSLSKQLHHMYQSDYLGYFILHVNINKAPNKSSIRKLVHTTAPRYVDLRMEMCSAAAPGVASLSD